MPVPQRSVASVHLAAVPDKMQENTMSQTSDYSILDSLLEGCQIVDPDYCYVYVNDALVKQARRAREELLGHTMMELYPGIESTPMFSQLERCMLEHVPVDFDNEFTFPDGATAWFALRMMPVPEGVFIHSIDITLRKQAETPSLTPPPTL